MHTVSAPPGEFKYEVGTKSVVEILKKQQHIEVYCLSSLVQESLVNITPMHTVSTPQGEFKYEVGTKSVVGNLI